MQISLSLSSMLVLSGVMFVLALMPTLSSMTVAARSMSSGFIHGIFTSLGVVAGDVIFILLAIFGLSVLTQLMGDYFVYIKTIGGAYLIWLGMTLWSSKLNGVEVSVISENSLLSSYMSGLLITLGDQKAVLFYLGFFPVFFDLSTISVLDTSIVIAIAIISVGGAKLCYAYLASKAGLLVSSKAHRLINIIAGSILLGAGVLLIMDY